MEMKIILVHLLNEYNITVDKDIAINWHITFMYSFTPENAIKITRIKE
jgi:hypothetical protein